MDFNLSVGEFTREQKFEPLDTKKIYDVLIIGGGPAGLTAAVYCIRKGITTGLIVKEIGGQVAWTSGIENYMGYRHINGMDLVNKFKEQVFQFGIDYDEGSTVKSITYGTVKNVHLEDGRIFLAKALIIATGKAVRKLNVPGEDEFTGKGVAYCATCDAPFFIEKRVIVVGGGNSGIEAAIDLAKVAKQVIIIQFLDTLTGDQILINKLKTFKNVNIFYQYEVVEIKGGKTVEVIKVRNRLTGQEQTIEADGIFVEIGLIPNSQIAKDVVELNNFGEIIIDCACKTDKPGIFAAGDVTSIPFKQIIIAGGEGAKAALSACEYVLKQ